MKFVKVELIPYPDRLWREDEPQTVPAARQSEADKATNDLEMEYGAIDRAEVTILPKCLSWRLG